MWLTRIVKLGADPFLINLKILYRNYLENDRSQTYGSQKDLKRRVNNLKLLDNFYLNFFMILKGIVNMPNVGQKI